jgi:hypothetical protein
MTTPLTGLRTQSDIPPPAAVNAIDMRQLAVGWTVMFRARPRTSAGKLRRRTARGQHLASTLGHEGTRALGDSSLPVATHLTRSPVGRAQHTARRMRPANRKRTGRE